MKTKDGGPAFPAHDLSDGICNASMHGMSLRQYAAIKLQVPDSGTDWLDKMIRESRRDRFAGQALGSLRCGDWEKCEYGARWCYDYADAMLAAREEKQ